MPFFLAYHRYIELYNWLPGPPPLSAFDLPPTVQCPAATPLLNNDFATTTAAALSNEEGNGEGKGKEFKILRQPHLGMMH